MVTCRRIGTGRYRLDRLPLCAGRRQRRQRRHQAPHSLAHKIFRIGFIITNLVYQLVWSRLFADLLAGVCLARHHGPVRADDPGEEASVRTSPIYYHTDRSQKRRPTSPPRTSAQMVVRTRESIFRRPPPLPRAGAASAGLASRCDAPVAGVPGTRFLVALSVLTLLLNPSSPFPILHNKLLAPAPPHPRFPPRQPNLPPRQLLEGHPRRPVRGHGGGGVRTVREEDGVPRP